ncbi:MAG: AI-2E family transporter [Acidobacteria bacterium]|nr:AI-2E family transporter [Acidobacteriota bacterium]
MAEDRFRSAFLLLLVIAVTLAFGAVLRPFATTILLAAILSGLVRPLYTRLERAFNGRRPLAAGVTLLLVLTLVIVPLFGVSTVVINQAMRVSERITPVIEQMVSEPGWLGERVQRLPGFERIEPFREQILTRLADVANRVGSTLVGWLSSGTLSTVNFVFQFFLLLYTMFFLLMDGPRLWRQILRHLPLTERDQLQMTERFLSVTRATVKGTLIIGLVQGSLSGLAFAVVGIPDALFWGVVMALLSVLPVVGGALVWVPACVILLLGGHPMRAVSLAAFCSLVVGSVDNLLRPRLVGRDTRMPDVVVLFSTLGGLAVLGASGFIIGPILAGMFITCWEIFTASRHPEMNPVITDGEE